MKRALVFIFLLVGFACAGFAGISMLLYHAPREYPEQTVIIPPGTGARGVLAQLHAAGLAPSPALMALPMLRAQQASKLKAGEYAFASGLSPSEIIAKIARGEVVIHKVTIPEGWNSAQIRAALMAEPLLTGELPAAIPEGSLFPDTMHFARGEARASVLARMQKAHDALLAELWQARAPTVPLTSPEQAVILASIVEKETGVTDERAKVAGVFYNRLRIGMKLQSDPTVVYGIEIAQGGAPMGRLLSRADLQTDTPHNTYTREGLPPTPICHPGRAAIAAVLNPEATDALYFVADGKGGHRFAASLREHDQNVLEYRRMMAQAASANGQ